MSLYPEAPRVLLVDITGHALKFYGRELGERVAERPLDTPDWRFVVEHPAREITFGCFVTAREVAEYLIEEGMLTPPAYPD